MRVLILEDDGNLRYTFAVAFSQQGHDVTQAACLQDAERALLENRPDVAVLDLMIGDQNSIDIASLLALLSPKTEIIFVTGSCKFPNAELFQLVAPVAAVLRKPVDVQHLVDLVSHIQTHRVPEPRGYEFNGIADDRANPWLN